LLEISEGFCQISVGWMSRLCIGKMTTAAPLPELLQVKLQPLRELCERYGVEKLELFGSAARGEFDPAHSDLDFIVQMKGRREPAYARRFCDFADALETLYGRPVDLLTELMIKNPYFKAEVQKDRTIVVDL
jgi:predicted nucleotidyltransferase